MNVPQWWLVLSGVFFALFILLIVAALVLTMVLIALLRELAASVKALGEKADLIGTRVEKLVVQVQSLSGTFGRRANSIAENVDVVTSGIARKVDLVATAFLVLSAIGKIGSRFRK